MATVQFGVGLFYFIFLSGFGHRFWDIDPNLMPEIYGGNLNSQ